MSEITENIAKSILEVSKILNIKGKVLPSTLKSVVLGAEFEDGTKILGQTRIVNYPGSIKNIFLSPKKPTAYEGVIKACQEAENNNFRSGKLIFQYNSQSISRRSGRSNQEFDSQKSLYMQHNDSAWRDRWIYGI